MLARLRREPGPLRRIRRPRGRRAQLLRPLQLDERVVGRLRERLLVTLLGRLGVAALGERAAQTCERRR